MTRKNKFSLGLIAISIVLSLFIFQDSFAQSDSSDAIGVRIVPNPNHYSISRWYESQGFQGSPQALLVDGYEAIRDGRTVYVNAANIDLTGRKIYTNIYLISYNQNSAPNTVDILGQIVSHWKFNNNLSQGPSATCAISSLSCTTDVDCVKDSACAITGVASSSCVLKSPKNCLVDTDCPTNFFCDNLKSQITRDVKRLGQLEELKEALANFKKVNNRFPSLSAGTYLAGHSISLWPSWAQVLLSDLALPQNFIDPVNRLGACPNYDQKTCWNKDTQKFIYDPAASSLTLPAGSYAFVYSTDSQGSNYNLCATLESRHPSLNYHFSPNDPISSNCVTAGIISGGQAINTAPRLVEKSLTGETGREFNGFIKVIDTENNPLSWSIAKIGAWAGWVEGPILIDTSNPNQKKVYAKTAGPKGTYDMTLTVSDGQGGILTTSTPITIFSSALSLEAADAEYVLDPVNNFEYNFSFGGNSIINPSSAYSISLVNGPFNLLSSFTKSFSVIANNKYQVSYRGLISTSTKFYQDTDFRYNASVAGSSDATNKIFTIKVKVENPVLNLSCADSVRIGKTYDCLLGSATQGNHTINYSGSGYPTGLSIINRNLTGTPTATAAGARVIIKATNEYGASSTKPFTLKVVNYCGDGIKQGPNMEERGGPYNDGYEDCDGTDGVTTDPAQSGISKQYGCKTTATSPRPYPILTNDQCVFLSPTEGGGYCGDTFCQVLYETATNCAKDCGTGAVTLPPITISGHITDYMTGDFLNGVSVVITNNGGATIGSTTTDSSGGYLLAITSSSDNYIITASLLGYSDGTESFTPNSNQTIDFILASPSLAGVARMQLSWHVNPAPPDLDSHLKFQNNHIYYLNQCDARIGANCDLLRSTANLDRDDINYVGDPDGDPNNGLENVRIVTYKSGAIYKYYIHDYTDGYSNCKFNGATVDVFNGGGRKIKTYSAPVGNSNKCFWYVFDMDSTGRITDRNIATTTAPCISPSCNPN